MGTEAPTPIVIPVQCAPKKAPCPKCGKRGRRKRTVTRRVRTVAYKAVAYLEITYGEYAARCDCSTTFRNTHEPTVLAELWPDADHQLCVFHVIKDVNKLILDAVRRMRTAMGRRGQAGRKKKRGRKGAKAKAAAKRRGLTVKEKARFVFKRRHLIVKRRENLTEEERDDLKRMLEYLPAPATLRRFADRICWVFDTSKDLHQASCRRSALVRDTAFLAIPELVKAMEQLDDEKSFKLMAYLNSPVSRRVRTNNHVERTNRMFRFLETVRYKWRSRRALVRFVVLALDGIWQEWTLAQTARAELPNQAKCGASQTQNTQQSICAA